MGFTVPPAWEQQSENLYVHLSSVRLQRMTYHSRQSWVLIPPGSDDAVLQFPPTAEGRDMAFAAFATGAFTVRRPV
jgi:hypothetical protein